MIFSSNGKDYTLVDGLRSKIKPGWEEMLKPAKSRKFSPDVFSYLSSVARAEKDLSIFSRTLVGSNILEIGCNEGARCFLMAKYEGTTVHGIDVDEYTVDQSPDLNTWNPRDYEFVHNHFSNLREQFGSLFPEAVRNKVTFETCSAEKFASYKKYDVIVSWDTIEHILDLEEAFHRIHDSLVPNGVSYHEYNPFFSINGGHSLCTLDFLYGHCVLSDSEFDRYIREVRPEEEKIDLNFYHKCLNRATRADIKKFVEKAGLEILYFDGVVSFHEDVDKWRDKIEIDILPDVKLHYPNVTADDLMCDSVQLIVRKPC